MIPSLKSDLETVYSKQLEKVLIYRRFFRQLTGALPLAGHESGMGEDYDDQADELKWFIYDGHVAHSCIAIRRITDGDSRTISLVNILRLLKPQLALVTRDAFCRSYIDPNQDRRLDAVTIEMASKEFDKITLGDAELTEAQIDKDIEALKKAAEPVKALVDQVIAHTDRGATADLKYSELDDAIDIITSIFNRYALLLDCSQAREDEMAREFSISLPLARAFP